MAFHVYEGKIGPYRIQLYAKSEDNPNFFLDGSNIYANKYFEVALQIEEDDGVRTLSHDEFIALDIHLEQFYYYMGPPPCWNPDSVPIDRLSYIVQKLHDSIYNPISLCNKCGGNVYDADKLCWGCRYGI